MRVVLILWLIPIVLFWGWYGLSANDINLGSIFLSRAFHDHIFKIYGQILGMHPSEVPAKLAWVFFIDTLIILAVAAFRWRTSWLPQTIDWCRKTLDWNSDDQDLVAETGPAFKFKEEQAEPAKDDGLPPNDPAHPAR